MLVDQARYNIQDIMHEFGGRTAEVRSIKQQKTPVAKIL
jgi:hypothetical protein